MHIRHNRILNVLNGMLIALHKRNKQNKINLPFHKKTFVTFQITHTMYIVRNAIMAIRKRLKLYNQ